MKTDKLHHHLNELNWETAFSRDESSFSVRFNLKRILDRFLRYWYLVILSIVTALISAFLVNRYATPVYSISASIIVRESHENAAAEFLYKSNPLINPNRNYYNEPYIMKSYPLIQRVIEELSFHISWYREGKIKTSEVFLSNFPVSLNIESLKGARFIGELGFTILSPQRYKLKIIPNDELGETIEADLDFGEPLQLKNHRIVFEQVAEIPESWVGRNYQIVVRDPSEVAKEYSSKLVVSWAELGSSVVNLEIKGTIPEKEVVFLTEYIEQYQQYDLEKKNQTATKAIEFLDRQLAIIGDSLSYFDRQLEDFKQNQLYADITSESERLLNKLQQLETQRTQIILQNNYLNYLQDYLVKDNHYDQVVPPSSMGINDNVLAGLIDRLTELQFGLRMLRGLQTEKNPLVADRLVRIEELKKDILEGTRSMQASYQINLDFINKQIKDLEKELVRLPVTERELLNVKRKYSIRENLYLFLMQKRAEAGISRASTTSDIMVVNPPSRKGGPISPKPLRNYILAFVFGSFIPFLIFSISELLNNKIQSREDVERLTRIPLIGGIGHSDTAKGNLVVYNSPKSSLSESFRALRSNLGYFTRDKSKCVVVITSSISGEGKTFITINLATVIAFAGKKVLIIDADMRKPKIFSDFDLKNDAGLSTYLAGLVATPLEVIQKSGIKNLDVMSSGPVPPNPSELLLLPRVSEMISLLVHHYDYILMDTPPLGLVSDAFSLISLADHTLFMVRQDYTPFYYLRDLQEVHEQRDLKNISILLNDIKRIGLGYGYGYGYAYGYGYGYGYNYGEKAKSINKGEGYLD